MGFGTLFMGYMVTFLIGQGNYGAFAQPIGEALIIYSMLLLKDYNKNFKYCIYPAVPMVLCSVYSFMRTLDGIFLFEWKWVASGASDIVDTAYFVFSLAFNILMLFAIISIAKETGLEKISKGAAVNIVIVSVYYLLCLLGEMPFMHDANRYLVPFALTFWLLAALVTLFTLFRCYRYICSEDDLGMERRKTGIEFLDNINTKFDEREKKAREDDAAYKLEKMESKYNKYKNRVDAARNKKHKK